MRMQRAESHGQAAGDDGNGKDSEKPVAETPAAKLAASSEEPREPGSAKSVSKKRGQDTYRYEGGAGDGDE